MAGKLRGTTRSWWKVICFMGAARAVHPSPRRSWQALKVCSRDRVCAPTAGEFQSSGGGGMYNDIALRARQRPLVIVGPLVLGR